MATGLHPEPERGMGPLGWGGRTEPAGHHRSPLLFGRLESELEERSAVGGGGGDGNVTPTATSHPLTPPHAPPAPAGNFPLLPCPPPPRPPLQPSPGKHLSAPGTALREDPHIPGGPLMGSSTARSIPCDPPQTPTQRWVPPRPRRALCTEHPGTQSTQHRSTCFLGNKSSQRSQRGLRGRSPLGDAQQCHLMQMQQPLTSSQQ